LRFSKIPEIVRPYSKLGGEGSVLGGGEKVGGPNTHFTPNNTTRKHATSNLRPNKFPLGQMAGQLQAIWMKRVRFLNRTSISITSGRVEIQGIYKPLHRRGNDTVGQVSNRKLCWGRGSRCGGVSIEKPSKRN